MKLFFVSDLHGSLSATEQALALYQASGAQSLILLGDVLNHGPRNPIPQGYNPVAVAEKLNQFAQQIIAVRGNCDSEVDQMLLSFPMMSDSLLSCVLIRTSNVPVSPCPNTQTLLVFLSSLIKMQT